MKKLFLIILIVFTFALSAGLTSCSNLPRASDEDYQYNTQNPKIIRAKKQSGSAQTKASPSGSESGNQNGTQASAVNNNPSEDIKRSRRILPIKRGFE